MWVSKYCYSSWWPWTSCIKAVIRNGSSFTPDQEHRSGTERTDDKLKGHARTSLQCMSRHWTVTLSPLCKITHSKLLRLIVNSVVCPSTLDCPSPIPSRKLETRMLQARGGQNWKHVCYKPGVAKIGNTYVTSQGWPHPLQEAQSHTWRQNRTWQPHYWFKLIFWVGNDRLYREVYGPNDRLYQEVYGPNLCCTPAMVCGWEE